MRIHGVDRRAMATLSAGHLFTDVAQGSVPALLPFLIAKDHLSYASASALVLAATISSSVIQPLFGHLSDRRSLPWLMPLGPALGGLGVALIGIASSYGLIFACVLLSGLGVAAFHPEGSRFANYVSGARRASGMSLFSVGGNVGFALGPVIITPLVLVFGLRGTLFVLIPTWLMAAVMVFELPRLRGFRSDLVGGKVLRTREPEAWRPFWVLAAVIALRSFVYFGLVTFIPLYYVRVLHSGKALGNGALAAMLLGGAAGTLIGGPLADRFGRRAVLAGSMLVLPPLVVGFLLAGPGLAVVFAAVAGAATIATFAVTIVMGQEYLPGRLGISSGVTIGLSIGLGGVGAPLLGLLADAHGLTSVFIAIAVLPVLALALTFALPRGVPAASALKLGGEGRELRAAEQATQSA
ncbi:MAG TPA: MFS transporter [Solirubrobacteraceae bacterium]|jgi:FSR family fosmidomycin resistance protein-like MFS transporter|nr:MFS transporter [Solirubrobacteraceae bacterium]